MSKIRQETDQLDNIVKRAIVSPIKINRKELGLSFVKDSIEEFRKREDIPQHSRANRLLSNLGVFQDQVGCPELWALQDLLRHIVAGVGATTLLFRLVPLFLEKFSQALDAPRAWETDEVLPEALGVLDDQLAYTRVEEASRTLYVLLRACALLCGQKADTEVGIFPPGSRPEYPTRWWVVWEAGPDSWAIRNNLSLQTHFLETHWGCDWVFTLNDPTGS